MPNGVVAVNATAAVNAAALSAPTTSSQVTVTRLNVASPAPTDAMNAVLTATVALTKAHALKRPPMA